ncbi:LysE family translocator [Fusobacterium canifelinum]|uniref:Lysine transporter LysE n=1 Tax=Fusobacterium canifelinum TaxID=285729 RepID=A0A7T9R1M5_9FUSO|nr:LysE family transporter [Fusobacterium canifelinum]QQB73440.1 lysine transporter LysE [Fusobacterium canifelinum]QQS86948.1 lysine transporter LysE [Fusobacterium canifelinum]
MDITILKGILTGIILSLPFGPVGVYCMELTIVEGRWKGYITALGMVTMDMVYSTVALLFLSSVKEYVIKYENHLSLFIGIFLMIISLKKLLKKIELKELNVDFKSMLQNYLTGVGFAVVNISTVLLIATVFAFLRVLDNVTSLTSFETIIGVGLGGSGLWFFTTYLISHFRRLFGKEKLIKIIKVANGIIFILALFVAIYSTRQIMIK